MQGQRINDIERRIWVLNDEKLFLLWRKDGRAIKKFIRDNRAIIDELIDRIMTAKEQLHYFINE
jgi:hypothetical protein